MRIYYLDELHAKLVYAEALLIRALLTFIQDQGLFSFISGALKIKECHDLFAYDFILGNLFIFLSVEN